MKNFDIEKLQRKNIYETPDEFFGSMQQNVLAKTSGQNPAKSKTKIFTLNWQYAAAASLIVFFGLVLFWQQNTLKSAEDQNVPPKTLITTSVTPEVSSVPEAQLAYETLQNDLNSLEEDSKTSAKVQEKTVLNSQQVSKTRETKIVKETQPEEQLEEIISEFSNREIADLSAATEQDVYLDLYN